MNSASTQCGGRINIIKHSNDYTNCGTLKNDFDPLGEEGSAYIQDHQRLTIKQLVNQGISDNKCTRNYLNSKVHNIISSHHQIKINDPDKHDTGKKDEEIYNNPEKARVEELAKKNQMTIRDDLVKQDVIYLEKFVEPTYKKYVFIDEKDPEFEYLG